MNQRIRELIEQATHTAMWPGDPDAGELDAERFAELIAKECMSIADEYDGVGSTIVSRIKEHFGVDE